MPYNGEDGKVHVGRRQHLGQAMGGKLSRRVDSFGVELTLVVPMKIEVKACFEEHSLCIVEIHSAHEEHIAVHAAAAGRGGRRGDHSRTAVEAGCWRRRARTSERSKARCQWAVAGLWLWG